jgi:hypothetical protein
MLTLSELFLTRFQRAIEVGKRLASSHQQKEKPCMLFQWLLITIIAITRAVNC